MIPLLSDAIIGAGSPRAGVTRDVLLSAYVGSMGPAEQNEFIGFEIEEHVGRYPARFSHCLLGTFPQLGASVRTWPKLAEELEQKGRIPRIKPFQARYRREVHVSLWKVITSLQVMGQTKAQISELIGRHGL